MERRTWFPSDWPVGKGVGLCKQKIGCGKGFCRSFHNPQDLPLPLSFHFYIHRDPREDPIRAGRERTAVG